MGGLRRSERRRERPQGKRTGSSGKSGEARGRRRRQKRKCLLGRWHSLGRRIRRQGASEGQLSKGRLGFDGPRYRAASDQDERFIGNGARLGGCDQLGERGVERVLRAE